MRIIFLSVLAVSLVLAFVLLGLFVKTVDISNGTDTFSVKSFSGNVGDAVKSLGLNPEDYKVLKIEKTKNKTVAHIEKTFPVTITVGEKTVNLKTVTATVSDILKLAGYKVDEFDMVEPSAETMVTKKTVIDYMDINYITENNTEVIPYTTKTVFSNKMPYGTSTSTGGANGLKVVTYVKKLVNGVEVEKLAAGEQIITNAVGCVKTVGTGNVGRVTTGVSVTTSSYAKSYSTLTPDSEIPLDENGIPTNYIGHKTVQATAYTYTGHNMSTGKAPQVGYIAVNPKVIPYGTKMYIVSSDGNYIYGYAVAADTGGFTKKYPNNVDLFFGSLAQCKAFGRRNIEIYFLP